MSKNQSLHDALRHLERATTGLNATAAVQLVDSEIAELRDDSFAPHFEVHKAGLLWNAGLKKEAIAVLEKTAAIYEHVDSVHYFLGEYLVEQGEFYTAIQHLTKCIEDSKLSDDHWYEDSALLLRAYCAANIRNIGLARSDLARIADGEEMSWIPVEPAISKSAIQRMVDASGC